jgi:hypothetical protein
MRTLQARGIRQLRQPGDADAHRQPLGTLFDRLIVSDSAIVEYVPRPEYAAEVIALVDRAIGPSGVITARKPSTAGGPRPPQENYFQWREGRDSFPHLNLFGTAGLPVDSRLKRGCRRGPTAV